MTEAHFALIGKLALACILTLAFSKVGVGQSGPGGGAPISATALVQPAPFAQPNQLGALLNLGTGASLTPVANSHPPDQFFQGGITSLIEGYSLSRWSPTGARDMVLCVSGFATKPVETALVDNAYSISGATIVSGGTGHAVNDIVVMNVLANYAAGTGSYYAQTASASGVYRTVKVRIVHQTGGVADLGVDVVDPGIALLPPSATLSQVSTSGAGTGLQIAVTGAQPYAAHLHFGIDPVYGVISNPIPVTWNNSRQMGVNATNANATIGNQDALIPVGQTICSDPAVVNIPVGGKFAIRVWSDTYVPQGYILGNGGDGASRGGVTTPDTTALSGASYSPVMPTTTLISENGPSLILGTPQVVKPIWGLVGDSIEFGNSTGGTYAYDLGSTNNCQGWFVRAACANSTPVVSAASSGNQIAYLFQNNSYYYSSTNTFTTVSSGYGLVNQFSLFGRAKITDFFDGLGVNDTTANVSAAIIIADKQKLYSYARSRALVSKIGTMTLFPHATSTMSAVATGCQESTVTTWNIGGTNTNGELIYNALARDGLVPWNGTSGGTWDSPLGLGWTLGGSSVSTGAQTVTPNNMSAVGNLGGAFAVIPGVSIMVNPGGGNQEVVTPTATNGTASSIGHPLTPGTTFTATFVNAHAANEPMIVYSPLAYYPGISAAGVAQASLYPAQTINPNGADFIIDHSPYTESATGSCIWVSPFSTTTTAAISATGAQVVPLAAISGAFQGTTFTITVNSPLILDSGGNAESVIVTAISGNNVTIAPTLTHASGVSVRLKITNDGTHPSGDGPNQAVMQGHTWIAQNAAPQMAANQ